jgi:glycosyltransferase involved in cell wall biosynthesis
MAEGREPPSRGRVLSAVMFSPRGGSAHVARGLATELPGAGWEVTLVSGSRSDLDEGDARSFYAGLDPWMVDFAPALRSADPLAYAGGVHSAPIHPSFEDRPGAPDRVFAALDGDALERQVRAWATVLEAAGAARHDVLHLHHLTPINEAAARVAPDVPIVGQLHGTELLMLERIEAGAPEGWGHAGAWAARLGEWARRCRRLLLAPGAIERARRLVGVEGDRLVATGNGVDVGRFARREIDRAKHWRRHLDGERTERGIERGPGTSIDLGPLVEGVVMIYVGRFTAVKNLPALIGAFARARPTFRRPAALVLVGGHPGEWEGEHPAETIRRTGARDVHLAGWHAHAELADFFNAADVVVLASEREQFGQVLVEGMACGLPAIATRSEGPASIVADGETGWLVPQADEGALAEGLAEAVNDEFERRRRGAAAARSVAHRYGWDRVAAGVAEAFEDARSAAQADAAV